MKRRCVSLLICSALLLSGCSNGNTSDNAQNDSYVVDKEITISFDFGDRIGMYTGTIDKNGLPDGFGMFKTANDSGNDWIYYGEWENGHMDGNGITQWDNYSHYGVYESDYMEGVGMYSMNDGTVQCGEFEKSNLISSYVQDTNTNETSDLIQAVDIFSADYINMAVWVASSFGDNAIYSELGNMEDASGKYVQIIVPSDYTADDASAIIEEIGQAFALLKLLDTNYDTISVKYLTSDAVEILDFSFTGNKDGSYTLGSVSGNLENAGKIIKQIEQRYK